MPPPPADVPHLARRTMIWAGVVGLIYGGLARLLFAQPALKNYLGIVSLSFVFLVPLAFGALAVFIGAKHPKWGWSESIGMPCILTLICMGVAAVLGIEALICVFMAAPIMFVMAIIGGTVTFAVIRRNRRSREGKLLVTAFVLLPYCVAPVENLLSRPASLQTTHTQIRIAAEPGRVWERIARVEKIAPSELRWHPVYAIGFPRPIAATLSHEGVGGVRHATFERDVLFLETVDQWEKDRLLSFTIRAAGDFIPAATFDRHVTVGGAFFDVLSGIYRIEPQADRTVILHLASSHRLSTRFNWYAGLWSHWIMRQIQNSILHVIKNRCESGMTPAPSSRPSGAGRFERVPGVGTPG